MITHTRKHEIKEVVSTLIGKTLYSIAKENSIAVYEISFSEISKNIAGAIKFDKDNSTFIILIEEENSEVRKRFTLAHELGHYFLHKEKLIGENNIIIDQNSTMLYRQTNTEGDNLEEEANFFAAELLMPEHLIKLAREKLRDLDEMIKIFNVSAIAMSYRLTNLHLLNDENDI